MIHEKLWGGRNVMHDSEELMQDVFRYDQPPYIGPSASDATFMNMDK